MKISIYIHIILFSSGIVMNSCKSPKSIQETSAMTTPSDVQDDAPPTIRHDTLQCHFLVDFYSVGTGIDHSFNHFQEYLWQEHSRTSYSLFSWGMEGETKVCFHKGAYSPTEIDTVIQTTKELLQDGNNIRYEENVETVMRTFEFEKH